MKGCTEALGWWGKVLQNGAGRLEGVKAGAPPSRLGFRATLTFLLRSPSCVRSAQRLGQAAPGRKSKGRFLLPPSPRLT